jgi:hypothetical protein
MNRNLTSAEVLIRHRVRSVFRAVASAAVVVGALMDLASRLPLSAL